MEALSVYTDLHGLARLKGELKGGGNARLEEVAGQFSAVFTHMMLKSMRDAGLGEGIFDSNQSLFYRDMFDQQLALTLSQANGVGIRDMLVDHLRQATGGGSAEPALGAGPGEAATVHSLAAYRAVRDLTGPEAGVGPVQDGAVPADKMDSRNVNRIGPMPGFDLEVR